jgi:hypothetical protein
MRWRSNIRRLLMRWPPRFLRTSEAARFLALSARTLEKHRCYGTGPKYRKLGGRGHIRPGSPRLGRPRHQEVNPGSRLRGRIAGQPILATGCSRPQTSSNAGRKARSSSQQLAERDSSPMSSSCAPVAQRTASRPNWFRLDSRTARPRSQPSCRSFEAGHLRLRLLGFERLRHHRFANRDSARRSTRRALFKGAFCSARRRDLAAPFWLAKGRKGVSGD